MIEKLLYGSSKKKPKNFWYKLGHICILTLLVKKKKVNSRISSAILSKILFRCPTYRIIQDNKKIFSFINNKIYFFQQYFLKNFYLFLRNQRFQPNFYHQLNVVSRFISE